MANPKLRSTHVRVVWRIQWADTLRVVIQGR